MKHLLALAAALLALVAAAGAAPEIIVDRASPDIFPEAWLGPRHQAEAEPLPEADRARCRAIVEKALARYPAAVLAANLKTVYVVSRLRYSGVTAGGTNSRTAVYLVSNERFTPERFEGNFHAEFSSILLRNHPAHLDRDAWQRHNPPGFTYRGSGVQAVQKKQASLHLTDELHAEGFLNEYGKASIEEDFNSFAGRLFMGDAGLWRAIERHPRVKAKADLAIAFFTKLEPSLTAAFFQSLPRVVMH